MARFVFFNSSDVDAKALTAAKKSVRALGGIVVGGAAGSMLVEAPPTKAAQVAKALPGWHCAQDRKTARIPEHTPLQRAKRAAAKG